MEAEYLDIETSNGLLRITFEMSVGDLLVTSVVALLLAFMMLQSLLKLLWR